MFFTASPDPQMMSMMSLSQPSTPNVEAGYPVSADAEDYGLMVAQVHDALDRHPIELDRDKYLKRTLALELLRLDELEMAFRDKAIEDRDVASATLLVRVAERRATLLGLNPVTGANVTIVQHEPANALTSTQKIQAAIDHVTGVTPRERELADKQSYGDEPLTANEQAELDQRRQAREVKRLRQVRDTGEDTPPHRH